MHLITLVRYFRKLRRKKGASSSVVLSLLVISILGNAICFQIFERDGAGGPTMADALWYSVISVTTIGYGDYSATTFGARVGTVFFIVILGLGSFTVLLGMAIDGLTDLAVRERRGMSDIYATNHILIVNFPSASRVSQLIDELRADPQHTRAEIVVVTDKIESLPFTRNDVSFVHGPVLERETYERANVKRAKMAIVLANSYSDPNADAVVASAAAVIDQLHTEIYLVAECLNPAHQMLFSTVNCDAIVFSLTISGNLLAQEAQDPGISQMVDELTSSRRGMTLYSTEVTTSWEGRTYKDLAVKLLEDDISVICVNRDGQSLMSFNTLEPQRDDRVIYTASQRLTWEHLASRN